MLQSERLQSDLLISVVIMILSFAIHVSTVFIQVTPHTGSEKAALGFRYTFVLTRLNSEDMGYVTKIFYINSMLH